MTFVRKAIIGLCGFLAIAGIGYLAYSNSDQISVHRATLECRYDRQSETAPAYKGSNPFVVQLRYDWINGAVYRYSPDSRADGGAYKWKMIEKIDRYYDRERGGSDTAVFELRRDDLTVTLTFLNNLGKTKFWLSGQCEIVDPALFTTARNAALREQLDNQKI